MKIVGLNPYSAPEGQSVKVKKTGSRPPSITSKKKVLPVSYQLSTFQRLNYLSPAQVNQLDQLFISHPNPYLLKLCKDVLCYYGDNNWEADGLIKIFNRLALTNLTKAQLKVLDKFINYHKKNKWGLVDLLKAAIDLLEEKAIVRQDIEIFKKGISLCLKEQVILEPLFEHFPTLVVLGASPLVLETFINASTLQLKGKNLAEASAGIKHIMSCCKYLTELEAPVKMLESFNKSVELGYIQDGQEALKTLSEITAHAALCQIVSGSSKSNFWEENKIVHEVTLSDAFRHKNPYQTNEPGLDNESTSLSPKMQSEFLNVFKRALPYHGFSSLIFATRRPPSKEHCLLVRFARDVAKSVKHINAKDFNAFPGKGFVIWGPVLDKIFPTEGTDDSRFYEYKEAWPSLFDELHDLEETHFVFTRGFIAVSCKGNSKYELRDKNGQKVHYSYLIPNDHFHNYGCWGPILLPTKVLVDKLQGTLVSHEDFVGYSTNHKNINDVGFQLSDLINAANKMPANVLRLTWGANYNDGLCNAYQPYTSPVFGWEIDEKKNGVPSDVFGHIHKSKVLNKNLKMWSMLKAAHEQTHLCTKRYQNLLDLLRLAYAMWGKGFTVGERTHIEDITDINPLELTSEEEQQLVFSAKNDFSTNPNSNRMLLEAYKWYEGAKSELEEKGQIEDPNKYPVLVIADTLDSWTIPDTPILLDTIDMTLESKGKVVRFPRLSKAVEGRLWSNYILPRATSSLKELRFYDRRDLELLARKN